MGGIQDYFSRFTTIEADPAHDAEIDRMEREQAAADRLESYKRTAPERYHAESLDTYKATNEMQKHALNAARGFVHAAKCREFKTLCLIGSAGTGKTHLACGIIREAGGIYRTAPEIVEELRRAKSFSAAETEGRIVNYYGGVSLLVIDEIGRGINAADEKYMIYQLLKY